MLSLRLTRIVSNLLLSFFREDIIRLRKIILRLEESNSLRDSSVMICDSSSSLHLEV